MQKGRDATPWTAYLGTWKRVTHALNFSRAVITVGRSRIGRK
jgi:hypothetical protein